MGRSLQNVNKRYVGGARPMVNEVSMTDDKGKLLGFTEVATVATATAVTLTTAQVLGGLILQDPSGGAVTTTLPTAAELAAAIRNDAPSLATGTSFEFTIRNNDGGAGETITVAAGTGGTTSGTMTIATLNTKRFLVVFTSNSAYTLYSLGTAVT